VQEGGFREADGGGILGQWLVVVNVIIESGEAGKFLNPPLGIDLL
jgi:hypothetical protein